MQSIYNLNQLIRVSFEKEETVDKVGIFKKKEIVNPRYIQLLFADNNTYTSYYSDAKTFNEALRNLQKILEFKIPTITGQDNVITW